MENSDLIYLISRQSTALLSTNKVKRKQNFQRKTQ